MSRATRYFAPLLAVMLVVAAFVAFTGKTDPRHVTAYFSRAVSVYKGSEVRVMGVKIGTVTAVVPEGDDVRVVMEYDPEYKLPADAKAAIVTPTLTADRFVQIAPSYTGGELMADNAKIALPETGTPVELDRISQSLSDLTQALGPNGANKNGSLNTLLAGGRQGPAAATAAGQPDPEEPLRGGPGLRRQQRTALRLGPEHVAADHTLAANDRFVNGFIADLTSVSTQLAGDRGELAAALNALAKAVGTVRTFVHYNKGMVQKDVQAAQHGPRRAGQAQGRAEHGHPHRRTRPGQPDRRLRQQDQVDRVPASTTTSRTGSTSALLCDMIEDSGTVPERPEAVPAQLFNTLLAPPPRRSAPTRTEPEPAGPAQARRHHAGHLADGSAEPLKAGNAHERPPSG